MEISRLQFLVTILFTLMTTVSAYLPTFFMDEWCSTTLDLSIQSIEGGRLLLRPPQRGMRYLTCFVSLKAPQGKRLSLRFREFDIQSPFDCNQDHLQIFDDKMMRSELTGRMCNTGQTPSGVYTTTGQDGTVRLFKKNYLSDQIEIIFTSFHLAPCQGGEFQCKNSHCIADDLYCNGYDNCGDESDLCFLNAAGIAGVVIAAIVIIIIIAAIVAFIWYRRQQRRRMEKLRERQGVVVHDANGTPFVLQDEHLHYVDAWEKKSGLSDSRSTVSSRLSHEKNVNHSTAADNSTYEDTFTKKPLDFSHNDDTLPKKRDTSSSFKSDKKHGGSRIHFGPLTTSTLKKSRSENSLQDIYSVPKKPKKKWGLKRKTSSVKYLNDPDLYHQNFTNMASPYNGSSSSSPQMFGRNPSFREGMKGEGVSRIPIHTLDPYSLPGADQHLQSPDVYDHVISFRSYPSPQQSRKEKVVYLYPGHPGYHRLHHHGNQDDALHGDRASLHSSRSSLVKL
ncbi:uncharacterized protein [Littorina saxatilis]|uniref:CUB domain-containing protein n=1 Tax=Littorina saxatilis TaxID=31220 RepID=A0AAN9GN54_9CAEN